MKTRKRKTDIHICIDLMQLPPSELEELVLNLKYLARCIMKTDYIPDYRDITVVKRQYDKNIKYFVENFTDGVLGSVGRAGYRHDKLNEMRKEIK